jgi:hypothetical protein
MAERTPVRVTRDDDRFFSGEPGSLAYETASAVFSLCDIVEELADEVGKDEWPSIVREVLDRHRTRIRESKQ